ncbi:uncharacterized protein LOC131612763 [Vicia villosa]|uniref:uncharacterized protein LOC131612763 n=1 Tax=Vicia villosa TaxID=3911 RepID=UPI00273BD6C1|nr:uncharacterized protein LOC131612763 [Vicia villosa]
MGGVGAAATNSDDRYTFEKVSVWWDLETFKVPNDVDPCHVSANVHSELIRMNYHGSVSFFCYADVNNLPDSVAIALQSTGVHITHVPVADDKDVISKRILVDMMLWAKDNPAPASYLLISGGHDFSYGIYRLRLMNYNILLATQPQNVSLSLLVATKKLWVWTRLAAGGPSLSDEEYEQLLSEMQAKENSEK